MKWSNDSVGVQAARLMLWRAPVAAVALVAAQGLLLHHQGWCALLPHPSALPAWKAWAVAV